MTETKRGAEPPIKRMTLSDLLRSFAGLDWRLWIYMECDYPIDADTPVVVLNDDQLDALNDNHSRDAISVGKHRYIAFLNVNTLQDVLENLICQAAVTDEDFDDDLMFKAIRYYYERDAFIDISQERLP